MTTIPPATSSTPSIPGANQGYIGTYQVQRELGEGAFGVVYQAYQPFLDRQVAIKVIRTDFTANSIFEQQFMNEARTIARLRHPNIVSVYEFGLLPPDPHPSPYMVMEYLSGETLQTRMSHQRMTIVEVVRIIEQLADGLDYAHAHHIIHRDLKPANIIFSRENQPVIVDYGLAKLIALSRTPEATSTLPETTDQSSSTGTPAYMSPEQVMGEPTKPQSDQYALALIAYELLVGHAAFSSPDNPDILTQMMARLKEMPAPIHSAIPQIPEAANAVFNQAFAFAPDNRYLTVRDFARDLGDALLPDRRRNRIQIVSDPIQAALLTASRQTIQTGLWGAVAITALIVLYCVSLFVRSYGSSTSIFVSDGILVASPNVAGEYIVIGFWPDTVADKGGVQIGDVTKFSLSDYHGIDAPITINGQPRSALPPDWQPAITDALSYTVIRNGQPIPVGYRLARSNYKLILLGLALVPIILSFIGSILLLLRWKAEPGLQIFSLIQLAGTLALIGVALTDIAYGLIALALYTMLPSFIRIILSFPEPSPWIEKYPNRLGWLYLPLAFGLVQFLLGDSLRINGFEANLAIYITYAVILTLAIIFKWGRRDLKRYPGLWGIISIILASNAAAVIGTVFLEMPADAVFKIFGNGYTRLLAGYGVIFGGVAVGIVLSSLGYHLVQRQLGYSLVTQVSQQSEPPGLSSALTDGVA
jgi:serine/threonine protein kinase